MPNVTDGQETFASVTVTKTVTKRQVQNLLVGLFENGCSSWFHEIKKYQLSPGYKMEDFKQGGRMQDPDDYFHHSQIVPVTDGCSLVLLVDDPEGDEEKPILFELGPDQIKKGIEVMASKYPEHFNDWMEENDDATTSDVFGQCVVYGQEIFC